jgi:hypothetical protein
MHDLRWVWRYAPPLSDTSWRELLKLLIGLFFGLSLWLNASHRLPAGRRVKYRALNQKPTQKESRYLTQPFITEKWRAHARKKAGLFRMKYARLTFDYEKSIRLGLYAQREGGRETGNTHPRAPIEALSVTVSVMPVGRVGRLPEAARYCPRFAWITPNISAYAPFTPRI